MNPNQILNIDIYLYIIYIYTYIRTHTHIHATEVDVSAAMGAADTSSRMSIYDGPRPNSSGIFTNIDADSERIILLF